MDDKDLGEEESAGLSAELLVHHEANDAHHGGAAVVELDAALSVLLLRGEGVPAKVEEAVAEVARELARSRAMASPSSRRLEEANESEDLQRAGARHVEGASPALADLREQLAVANLARQGDAVL